MFLEVRAIAKSFGGLRALNGVSFEQAEGQTLGLIGPNGAGKTTLFNVISGMYAADSGEVRFGERRISGLKPHLICRSGIARTFQVAKPLGGLTVRENVLIGAFNRLQDRKKALRRADEILEQVGLAQYSNSHANSLNVASRKRLEMARALATEPRLLMLDEVMGGLNPTEVAGVVALIRKLVKESGLTVLLIEHVMQAIMTLSDQILVLDYGELIAQGKPDQVATNPKVIDAYLGAESDE